MSSLCLFHNLSKLRLQVNGEWPTSSPEFLSTLINLSCLNELVLDVDLTHESAPNTIASIRTLLERASNVRSLIITNPFTNMQSICLVVPRYVQHLEVSVDSVDNMRMILEQLKHLSSITFDLSLDLQNSISEIIEWLINEGRDFTYESSRYSLKLWLNKSMDEFI
jgi:hypothetical protein